MTSITSFIKIKYYLLALFIIVIIIFNIPISRRSYIDLSTGTRRITYKLYSKYEDTNLSLLIKKNKPEKSIWVFVAKKKSKIMPFTATEWHYSNQGWILASFHQFDLMIDMYNMDLSRKKSVLLKFLLLIKQGNKKQVDVFLNDTMDIFSGKSIPSLLQGKLLYEKPDNRQYIITNVQQFPGVFV